MQINNTLSNLFKYWIE